MFVGGQNTCTFFVFCQLPIQISPWCTESQLSPCRAIILVSCQWLTPKKSVGKQNTTCRRVLTWISVKWTNFSRFRLLYALPRGFQPSFAEYAWSWWCFSSPLIRIFSRTLYEVLLRHMERFFRWRYTNPLFSYSYCQFLLLSSGIWVKNISIGKVTFAPRFDVSIAACLWHGDVMRSLAFNFIFWSCSNWNDHLPRAVTILMHLQGRWRSKFFILLLFVLRSLWRKLSVLHGNDVPEFFLEDDRSISPPWIENSSLIFPVSWVLSVITLCLFILIYGFGRGNGWSSKRPSPSHTKASEKENVMLAWIKCPSFKKKRESRDEVILLILKSDQRRHSPYNI